MQRLGRDGFCHGTMMAVRGLDNGPEARASDGWRARWLKDEGPGGKANGGGGGEVKVSSALSHPPI